MTDEAKPRQPPRVTQDPASWQAGYNAGMSDGPSECPPEVPDRLAYAAGYIEGKAARDAQPRLNGLMATDRNTMADRALRPQ
jgi:hypothetical protein